MKRLLAFATTIIITFISLSFAVLNAGNVELKYYLGTLTIPLALLLVVVLLIGALLGGAASVGFLLHQRRETRRLRKKLSLIETELKNLREIPIKDTL